MGQQVPFRPGSVKRHLSRLNKCEFLPLTSLKVPGLFKLCDRSVGRHRQDAGGVSPVNRDVGVMALPAVEFSVGDAGALTGARCCVSLNDKSFQMG